jgi:glutathione S-transferase
MPTVTAFKWVPPFAQGHVRDHRIRWMLNEIGWPHDDRLINAQDQKSPEYRAEQPFGQVPVLEEKGRPPLFESGAIVLDLALRSGKLLPAEEIARAQVLQWYFAALNTLEMPLGMVAWAELFTKSEAVKRDLRPEALAMAQTRLGEIDAYLGDREFLVGDSFTIADLMMGSVLKSAEGADMIEKFPRLAAYKDRILSRPSYKDAIAAQCAAFAEHGPADMKYDKAG